MKIIKNISELKRAIYKIKSLGFTPTMGGLHSGHISLIKESQKKCYKSIVSIYVNPSQFNNKKDFKNYPRKINQDLKILKKLNVNFVFLPKTNQIYKNKRYKKILLTKREKIMCAKYRKGHFEGVIDIMDRLTNIIKPNYVFLGEKDYQQIFLIKKYVNKKNPFKIISCKTIRDKNFVALSSRNLSLSKKKLLIASYIAKRLYNFKKQLIKNNKNVKDISFIKKELITKFKIKIDYLEIRNEKNLYLYKNKQKFRLFIAYYLKKIRLIDNF